MARHVYACPLRWSDMDAFGHVNNVVFLRYLEEARIDFMFNRTRESGERALADGAVVAGHRIDYLRPLVHRHTPVTVETWVTELNRASLTVAYEIKDRGEDGAETVYVRASTVVVPYDLAGGHPRRLSESDRAYFARYMDAPGPDAPGADGSAAATAAVDGPGAGAPDPAAVGPDGTGQDGAADARRAAEAAA